MSKCHFSLSLISICLFTLYSTRDISLARRSTIDHRFRERRWSKRFSKDQSTFGLRLINVWTNVLVARVSLWRLNATCLVLREKYSADECESRKHLALNVTRFDRRYRVYWFFKIFIIEQCPFSLLSLRTDDTITLYVGYSVIGVFCRANRYSLLKIETIFFSIPLFSFYYFLSV